MKILITENKLNFQLLYERIMKRAGYKYDFASDYLEATELIEKTREKYDLCLLNVNIPYINNLDPLTKIRNKTKYIPTMIIAGLSPVPDKKYKEAGFDDFLEKPYNIIDLYDKIKKLTVKKVKITTIKKKQISLEKEIPMNKEELQELIELDKKGLALLVVENGSQRFVVHKNIQNKMSHKLIGEGKELFEFLDRGDNPANCHLYKCNMQTNRLLLTPEEFENRLIKENNDIEKYTTVSDQKYSENE